jgi:hypothetical protein
MKHIIFVLALAISMLANADEISKKEIIVRLVSAQGLKSMLEQQQTQMEASSIEFGKGMFQKMLSDFGVPENQQNPRLKKAFEDYLTRCSTMFTVDEYVDAWVSQYGKDVSEEDLKKILAYYESPIGRKDVQASQAALTAFTQTVEAESQKRMQHSVSQFVADMKAALVN